MEQRTTPPTASTERRVASMGATLLQPMLMFALLIAAWSFAKSWSYAPRWPCIDYYQFWAVGDALREGDVGNIYSEDERIRLGDKYAQEAQREFGDSQPDRAGSRRRNAAITRRHLETYSTPWLYTLFAVRGTGHYRHDLTWFQRFSLCSYVAALLIVCTLLGYSLSASALVVAALLEAFGPLLEDEGFGNVSRLQFAVLAVMMWLLAKGRFRWRFAAAGVLLGLSIAFKPNVAAVAAVLGVGWIVSAQWRKLVHVVAGSIVGVASAVALSSAYYGSFQCWRDWVESLSSLMHPGGWDDVNYSLPRALHELCGIEHTGWLAFVVPALAIVVLYLGRQIVAEAAARTDKASNRFVRRWDIFLVGFGATLPLLTSELAWFHYYLLALPLPLYLLRPRREVRNLANTRRLRGLCFVALIAISLDTPRMLFNLQPETHMYVVVPGAVLLFALGCWRCIADRREAARVAVLSVAPARPS